MNAVCETLLGPLAGPECRRALRGGSVLVARSLAVLPACLILLGVAWACWLYPRVDPTFSTAGMLRIGLVAVEGLLITASLILGPAVLAGALAGDRARGMLALLHIGQVSNWEIVAGRLAGRICLVGVLLLGSLPVLASFASAWEQGALGLAALMVLPVAIAVGGGGLALAFSAMARRGRDALLSAYLVVVLLVAAPLLVGALWPGAERWLGPLSPYAAVDALVESGDRAPILHTAGLWGLLGLAGAGWAAWRLRPDPSHDERARPHRQRRSLPPVGDRPLLWKELYVESRQSFHRFTRWAVSLLAIGLLAVGLTLAGITAWAYWVRSDLSWAVWAEDLLTTWLGWSWLVSWLIQWAVGLRAAAAIAVERERGTWDAILTSPLEGREIFQGKVYGSVYALRGLLLAAIVSWTLGLVCGAFTLGDYGNLLGETLIVSAFMAVLGAWASLSCASATRAMTWTMGGWLATRFAAMVLAGVLTAVGFLVGTMLLLYVEAVKGGTSFGGAAPAISYLPVYRGVWLLLYALATLALSYYCRRRFDRLLAPVLEEARVLPAKQNTRTSTR